MTRSRCLEFSFGKGLRCCGEISSRMGVGVAQWLAYLLPDSAAPGSIPSIPENFSEEQIVNGAKIDQQSC